MRPLLDEKLPGEAQIIAALDADLRFRQSHAIVEESEDAIRHVLPSLDIIVHAEPFEEEMRHQQEAH